MLGENNVNIVDQLKAVLVVIIKIDGDSEPIGYAKIVIIEKKDYQKLTSNVMDTIAIQEVRYETLIVIINLLVNGTVREKTDVVNENVIVYVLLVDLN